MDKKNNIDHIIESLEKPNKAVPSEAFLSKMEQVAYTHISIPEKVSIKYIMGIAASFTILLIMNIGLLTNSGEITVAESENVNEASYNLVPTKSLYNE